MFETMVLVCLLKNPQVCHTLKDIEGPYKTEKQCEIRAHEIAIELPEWMPEYIATRYKCNQKGNRT
jgi:hypothetical protein